MAMLEYVDISPLLSSRSLLLEVPLCYQALAAHDCMIIARNLIHDPQKQEESSSRAGADAVIKEEGNREGFPGSFKARSKQNFTLTRTYYVRRTKALCAYVMNLRSFVAPAGNSSLG